MSNIEEKLKEYRRLKENERKAELCSKINAWKIPFVERVANIFRSTTSNSSNESTESLPVPKTNATESRDNKLFAKTTLDGPTIRSAAQRKSTTLPKVNERKTSEAKEETLIDAENDARKKTIKSQEIKNNPPDELNWILLFLKIALWIILFSLSLELECGAIFVLFSAFYLIFTNFRIGKRQSWEPSAYSVFNPGCEAIDGTLKPEQFEREIRYGF